MKRFFIVGRRRADNAETCMCIMEAMNAEAAMEKATRHYGTLRYELTGCIECGSIEAKAFFEGRK